MSNQLGHGRITQISSEHFHYKGISSQPTDWHQIMLVEKLHLYLIRYKAPCLHGQSRPSMTILHNSNIPTTIITSYQLDGNHLAQAKKETNPQNNKTIVSFVLIKDGGITFKLDFYSFILSNKFWLKQERNKTSKKETPAQCSPIKIGYSSQAQLST